MSGGVDSSVAALLLKEQGVHVVGAYMKNWINEENIFGDCPWQQDIEDARATADALGIEFRVVNFIDQYKERIVEYLLDGYKRGITPNPDVMCNREMKFGVLLDYALQEGFSAVATGHYARKQQGQDGSFDLLEGVDEKKNQSYFLAMIQQAQLARAEFPIGELRKADVRAFALARKLPNAAKKDSQGICFIGNIRMSDFLRHYIADEPGEIVTTEGRPVGEHKGLHLYTIGQRRGLGVPSNTDHEHFVVVGKDLQKNRLLVAFDRPESPGLFKCEIQIHGISWINRPVREECRLLARPRYLDPLQAITFSPSGPSSATIRFDVPQRALTSGQILALHDGEVVLGGGIYT
jgi:tRNA-uridine 2-sulfurtransferase